MNTAYEEKTHPAADVVVRIEGVEKAFGTHRVLDGVSLEIRSNEFVALLGRSGGGKSTLLRLLEGLDTDYSGTILVPERRSVVFQEPRLLPWRRVWQNVVIGLDGRRTELAGKAAAILKEVGLTERAEAWPATLSGGEAQRVGLARALVREPELLLLDEPFGALDALTKLRSHVLLRQLVRTHRPGVLLVTHDVDEAIALADRIVVLDEGRFLIDLETPAAGSADARQREDDIKQRILAALGVDASSAGTTETPILEETPHA